jgi:hypothetical protein
MHPQLLGRREPGQLHVTHHNADVAPAGGVLLKRECLSMSFRSCFSAKTSKPGTEKALSAPSLSILIQRPAADPGSMLLRTAGDMEICGA